MNYLDITYQIAIFIYYTVVVVICFRLLLQNRNPVKTTSYLVVLLLLPVAGLLVFLLFGQDYRKDKLFSRKGLQDHKFIQSWTQELTFKFDEEKKLIHSHLYDWVKVVRLVMNNEQTALTIRNKAWVLHNGQETFEAIIRSIKSAQDHIHIEYYIVEDSEITNRLFDLLKQKARKGIEVRIIYDYVGSIGLSNKSIDDLKSAGIAIFPFMPVRFPRLTSKVNFRDHRKIVIVDGTVCFLGGVNLADRYDNRLNQRYWRDTHLKIEGEATKTLQLLFLLNWKFASAEIVEPSEQYFPKGKAFDQIAPIQITGSGPDSDWSSIMQGFFTAITEANEKILITTPYFIPNESMLFAITTAARAGIKVQMIIPKQSDSFITEYATHSFLKKLLIAGVEVHQYTKGFIHSKTLVIDDKFCTVGTTNMDYRSFLTNFEVNAFIYDQEITKILTNHFEQDLKDSTPLTLEEWKKRPFFHRILESLARLFAPLL